MGVIEKTTTGYTPSNYAIGFWVFSPGLFSPNVQGWSHFFQRLAKVAGNHREIRWMFTRMPRFGTNTHYII
jgi:hypothetical protein